MFKNILQKFSFTKIVILFISIFFVFGYIVFPLFQLILASKNITFFFTEMLNKQVLTACFNSILLSIITVFGSCFIGTYFAYTFHFKKILGKSLMATLVLLPMAIPPMVGVMSYLFLLGDNGLLMKILGLKNFQFSGWLAIIIIHIYSFYTLFYLFIGNSLKTIDSSVIEAAYSLGSSKTNTFFKIILPQLKTSLVSASLLTFMASMASFSAPFIFGGNSRFLTTEIYYSKINGDSSRMAILSLILTFISIIALILFRVYDKKITINRTAKGTIKKNKLNDFKKYNYVATILSVLFCLIILMPIISLFLISIFPENAMMQSKFNFYITFHNYATLFSNSDFLQPFFNSIQSASIAVILTLILGLMISTLIIKKKNIFKTSLEIVSSIPYGIPGTVIAICLIISFNAPSIFSFNTLLIGTFWILPIAYTIRNLPIVTQAFKVSLSSIDSSLNEAAMSMGASKNKVWRSITLPLIYQSIIESGMLVFVNAFGEFVATVLLYTYSTKTMPIEIYAQLRLYNNGMAATYGIVLFLLIICVIFLIKKWVKKF